MNKVLAATAISLIILGLVVGCTREVEKNKEVISGGAARDNVEVGITLGAWAGQQCTADEFVRALAHNAKAFSTGNVQKCIENKIADFGYKYVSLGDRQTLNGMK